MKWVVDLPLQNSIKLICPGQFAVGHLPHYSDVVDLLRDFKVIFVYPDLRDAIVSHMRFFSNPGRGQRASEAWKCWSDGPDKMLAFMDTYKESIINMYISMIGWIDEKDICKVSFEEIYGDYKAEKT